MVTQSEVHRQNGGEQRFRPGEQVLVSVDSLESPLDSCAPTMSGRVLLIPSSSPAQVENRIDNLGLSVEVVGLIPLSESEYSYDGPLCCTDPVSPGDLTGLSIEFVKAIESLMSGDLVVFEDLATLTMYVDNDEIMKLLTHLSTQTSGQEMTGVYGITRSAIDEELFRVLGKTVDRTVNVQ